MPRLTDKQLRERKIRIMKEIYKAVKEGPKHLGDLLRIAKEKHEDSPGKRTLQNYISELKDLEVIQYDEKTRRYMKPGVKKPAYSPEELKLALNHSRQILFGEDIEPGYADPYTIHPDRVAEYLATMKDNTPLMQHLRTGYFEDLLLLLEEYRDLTNISLPREGIDLENLDSQKELFDPKKWDEELHEDLDLIESRPKPPLPKDLERTKELRRNIADKFAGILRGVKEFDIPLLGWCDYCPHQNFTIKGYC